MNAFYSAKTMDSYNDLFYTAKYYALLVRSGSNQVSIVLQSDAESFMGLINSFFDKEIVKQKVENAKDIPILDDLQLMEFLDELFPIESPLDS